MLHTAKEAHASYGKLSPCFIKQTELKLHTAKEAHATYSKLSPCFINRVGQNCIYTVYGRIFGDFPAKDTVY
jgi:hypothetical protein